MADNNKSVGPMAAAKLVTLIKAETAKKYDKTGGKIDGSAEITGGIKVGGSSEFSSSINAGSEISSDMLLMAPIVALYDPATEESISFGVSGENAVKVTSPVSGGGTQYARLAVGTPTGDNDAATKAYVDSKVAAVGVTVDTALSGTSTNPVQNKAIKAALDGKLSTLGGEISGYLEVGQTVSAGGSVSVGRTSSDTGIHFEKAASNAGRISHGVAGVDDTVQLARLKVASPTEDDDAATKAYVDGRAAGSGAVRYDAEQSLTFEQKQRARKNIEAAASEWPTITGDVSLCPANVTDNNDAVHITTTKYSGDDFTLTLDCGPENALVRVKGIRTPTDAETNAAATVEYVKNKVSEVSSGGGVDVDNALSATSTNPVQNKVVTAALTGKAGTAVATTSANGLMSKEDKAKLDGIADGATQVTIDSAMSGSSNNPVANHVVKQYVDDKVAAAGSNITVDTSLSSTSTNPVQNKAVKAAIDAKADKTALDAKMDKSGGTFTGNVYGKYFCGTWLQSTSVSDLGRTPSRIAVLDDSGWVYYRTASEILNDIGGASKEYVDDHATGGATKVNLSGTIEGEVSGYTSSTYQQIVNEIAKNCNIWLTIDGETIRLASWKRSGSADYKLVFFGAGSGALTVKYEVTASASSASMTITGG